MIGPAIDTAETVHAAAARRTLAAADRFWQQHGYHAPYWKLVDAARIALRQEGFEY